MTTLKLIELSCPICGNEFTSNAVCATDTLGGRCTDFRERSLGEQPLPYLIHLCPRCGYAGREYAFAADADVGPELRQHVWRELMPRLTEADPTGSEKYEFAARVAIWLGEDARRVAELWLCAAWCCIDEDDVEAERYFRRLAAWSFEQALSTYDGVERDQRALVTYLVGELWRRIGDERRAARWFDDVRGEVTRPKEQQWIVEAARRQKENPREQFA